MTFEERINFALEELKTKGTTAIKIEDEETGIVDLFKKQEIIEEKNSFYILLTVMQQKIKVGLSFSTPQTKKMKFLNYKTYPNRLIDYYNFEKFLELSNAAIRNYLTDRIKYYAPSIDYLFSYVSKTASFETDLINTINTYKNIYNNLKTACLSLEEDMINTLVTKIPDSKKYKNDIIEKSFFSINILEDKENDEIIDLFNKKSKIDTDVKKGHFVISYETKTPENAVYVKATYIRRNGTTTLINNNRQLIKLICDHYNLFYLIKTKTYPAVIQDVYDIANNIGFPFTNFSIITTRTKDTINITINSLDSLINFFEQFEIAFKQYIEANVS